VQTSGDLAISQADHEMYEPAVAEAMINDFRFLSALLTTPCKMFPIKLDKPFR
jgi:hypothetical protein